MDIDRRAVVSLAREYCTLDPAINRYDAEGMAMIMLGATNGAVVAGIYYEHMPAEKAFAILCGRYWLFEGFELPGA